MHKSGSDPFPMNKDTQKCTRSAAGVYEYARKRDAALLFARAMDTREGKRLPTDIRRCYFFSFMAASMCATMSSTLLHEHAHEPPDFLDDSDGHDAHEPLRISKRIAKNKPTARRIRTNKVPGVSCNACIRSPHSLSRFYELSHELSHEHSIELSIELKHVHYYTTLAQLTIREWSAHMTWALRASYPQAPIQTPEEPKLLLNVFQQMHLSVEALVELPGTQSVQGK